MFLVWRGLPRRELCHGLVICSLQMKVSLLEIQDQIPAGWIAIALIGWRLRALIACSALGYLSTILVAVYGAKLGAAFSSPNSNRRTTDRCPSLPTSAVPVTSVPSSKVAVTEVSSSEGLMLTNFLLYYGESA